MQKILPKDTFFTDYEVEHEFPRIGRKTLLLNARKIRAAHSAVPIILLAMEDISQRKELEGKLRDYAVKLNAAVSARTKELESRVRQLEHSSAG